MTGKEQPCLLGVGEDLQAKPHGFVCSHLSLYRDIKTPALCGLLDANADSECEYLRPWFDLFSLGCSD